MLRDLLRILMVGAFIVAVGALVADEMMSSVFVQSRREVERSDVVTQDAERLMRLAVDLETGVRGYLPTGDDRHLEPYHAAEAALPPLTAELRQWLADDPTGREIIDRIAQLLADWRRQVSGPLLEARRSGSLSSAADLQRTGNAGKWLVDQIRLETEHFRAHERTRREAALIRLEGRRRHARLLIGGALVTASLLTVAAMLLLTRRLGRGIARLIEVSESIADAKFDVEIGDERNELGRLARSLRSTAQQLDRRTRLGQALQAAGRALSDPTAQGQLLPALHEAIRDVVDLKQLVLLRVDEGGQECHVVAAHPSLPAEEVTLDVATPIRPGGALAHVIAARRSLIVRDVRDDRWPENERVRRLGASWYVFVPLLVGGRVEALLGASANSSEGNLDHGDQAFFDLLGQQIAGTLTTARLYSDLAERNHELERAGRAKSDFLALMSHELRTPLNSIIGFSQVLIDQKYGPLTERQARYQQNIYSSGRHLLQLINDLLDLSKIEAGRFTVELHGCALNELVVDALATLKPLADGKQLVLRNAPPPPPVLADALRLKQVLYNVLSNAIKFTPNGGLITLAHELVDDGRTVRFAISDSGPGISEEDQRRLFLPFGQVGSAGVQGLGTGLGLLLSRQLIELMGGQMGLQSTVGQGATFFFDLPLATPQPARAAARALAAVAPAPHVAKGPLALIVDDQVSARELLQDELEHLGYRTLQAENGETALELARAAKPDLITLDIMMPALDGWEVLRQLREDPALGRIPVLIISITDDGVRAQSLGALDQLVKPLHKGALHEVLARHQLLRATVTVLAVDDDREHLDMMRLLLEPLGFHLRTAETGAAGISAALAGPADVMVLDLQLPDRSGIDIVHELRRHERLRKLPILLLTGAELSTDERSRLNGEVVAELGKSALRPDELIRHIEGAVAGARRNQEA